MERCTPYQPRPTTFRAVIPHGDWRLRHWTIEYRGLPLDHDRFQSGRALALAALPEPARTTERPGVGFLIEHAGNGVDYIVLGWWDRENELPLRIFVRDTVEWRPARGGESVCVWDLEVIARERERYVTHVLGRSGPDVERYLAE